MDCLGYKQTILKDGKLVYKRILILFVDDNFMVIHNSNLLNIKHGLELVLF